MLIGFNNDMAWSHTVSTAQRFSFFELTLDENDPFKYRYDDEFRDIEVNRRATHQQHLYDPGPRPSRQSRLVQPRARRMANRNGHALRDA